MNTSKREEWERRISQGNAEKSWITREEGGIYRIRIADTTATPPPPSFFSQINTIRRKEPKFLSKSLADLSSETRRRRMERRRTKSLSDVTLLSADVLVRRLFAGSTCHTENGKKNEAGRRVIALLMLNAWRRRRADVEEARGIVEILSREAKSLNMQVYVMRQLLDNTKRRGISGGKELEKHLSRIEKYEEEKKLLLEDNESLECRVKDLQDVVARLQSKCKNLENDLDTAKLEAETWELTLKKERKKLKAVKEENATLQKEGESKEYQLGRQSQCLEELKTTIKELQEELDTQVPLLREAMIQIQSAEEKLKLSDEMEMEQEKIIVEKDEEIKRLKGEMVAAEHKFREQDERNGELGKLISEKTKELAIINEKLEEFVKREKFWGKRMVKMAWLCTRIPIACIYTVATLLLPQPWYRLL